MRDRVNARSGDAKGKVGNARKTHCKHGHPLSGDNLKITKLGFRHCKACARLYQARHREVKNRLLGRTPSKYPPIDEAKAAKVLTALREGKTLNTICASHLIGRYVGTERITDPILFREYCENHPDIAREAGALLAENTKAADARKGSAKRNQTHCKFGHPLSGDNLLVEGKTKFRRCRICMARRAASPRPPPEEQIQQATAALNAGQTITRICSGINRSDECA
jgi:hypothetical protein